MAIDTESQFSSGDGGSNIEQRAIPAARRARKQASLRANTQLIQSSRRTSRQESVLTEESTRTETRLETAVETQKDSETQKFSETEKNIETKLEITLEISPPARNVQQLELLEDEVVGLVSLLRDERDQKKSLAQKLDISIQKIGLLTADNDRLEMELAGFIRDSEDTLQENKNCFNQTLDALNKAAQELKEKASEIENDLYREREENKRLSEYTKKINEDFESAYKVQEDLKADLEMKLGAAEAQLKHAESRLLDTQTQLEKSQKGIEEKIKLNSIREALQIQKLEEARIESEEKAAAVANLESQLQKLTDRTQRLEESLQEKAADYVERTTKMQDDYREAEVTSLEDCALLYKDNELKDFRIQKLEERLDEVKRSHENIVRVLKSEHASALEEISVGQQALLSQEKFTAGMLKEMEERHKQDRNNSLSQLSRLQYANTYKDDTIASLQSEFWDMNKARQDGLALIETLKDQIEALEKMKADSEQLEGKLEKEERRVEEDSVPQTGDAVVICIDTSGSMSGAVFTAAKRVFATLIRGIISRNHSTHLGLLTHGDNKNRVTEIQSLLRVEARMEGLLTGIYCQGGFERYKDALSTAQSMLDKFKVVDPAAELRIITIGDGGIASADYSPSYHPPPPHSHLRNDIPVHAIILDNGYVNPKVEAISRDTNGRCFLLSKSDGFKDSTILTADELVGRFPPVDEKERPQSLTSSTCSSFRIMSPFESSNRSSFNDETLPRKEPPSALGKRPPGLLAKLGKKS